MKLNMDRQWEKMKHKEGDTKEKEGKKDKRKNTKSLPIQNLHTKKATTIFSLIIK